MYISSFLLVVNLVASYNIPSLKFWRTGNHILYSKRKKYPLSDKYFENGINRLNMKKNATRVEDDLSELYNEPYFKKNDFDEDNDDDIPTRNMTDIEELTKKSFRIIISKNGIQGFPGIMTNDDDEEDNHHRHHQPHRQFLQNSFVKKEKKSEHFEVLQSSDYTFADVGGYDLIKQELHQCLDLLKNSSKYEKYNVRVPKGIIFEGPPGNGKTLIAKALAGEADIGFIPVSGSEFQEKYVGVGASRIRELFNLAKKNRPCIIFIDEIDALGRKRADDGELSSSERDNTLNELLVSLDGFKNITGVFVIGATNRADLLDPALLRPGRIDKRIYIGLPDSKTRECIFDIHIRGKPHDDTIEKDDVIDMTNGFSGSQIENLLNEAMLNALRENREEFTFSDIEYVQNKMLVGWQPTEHQFTDDIIDRIAIHEMGHVAVGLLCKHHSNVSKVVINLSSPKSPAYTVFDSSVSSILTRESLFEHLMILLAGRIAEEIMYGVSVTTGAINDFEEAYELAVKMITFYGMGKNAIYPNSSEKYKELIDREVDALLHKAYDDASYIVQNSRRFIVEGAEKLKKEKTIKGVELLEMMINNLYETPLVWQSDE